MAVGAAIDVAVWTAVLLGVVICPRPLLPFQQQLLPALSLEIALFQPRPSMPSSFGPRSAIYIVQLLADPVVLTLFWSRPIYRRGRSVLSTNSCGERISEDSLVWNLRPNEECFQPTIQYVP